MTKTTSKRASLTKRFAKSDDERFLSLTDTEEISPKIRSMRLLALAYVDRIDAAERLAALPLEDFVSRVDIAKHQIAAGILSWMKGDASEGLYAMEALIPYRNRRARWVLEAKIYRAAMLSDFGDFGAVSLLKRCLEETTSRGFDDLRPLALTALLEAKQRFVQAIDPTEQEEARAIRPLGMKVVAMRLAGIPDEALEMEATSVPIFAWKMPDAWIKSHHPNLESRRSETNASLFAHLPDTPLMRTMACASCDNRCCYDGVYVTKDEEDRIVALRKRKPAYFKGIPADFTEDGEWGFLFQGRRTKLRPHVYTKPEYPAHFGKTKCVLAMPNGECAPQRAGADLGYHPWRFKPSICWKFPLIGLFNDNAMEKPHYFGEADPHAYDENQRGYLSFLPCATLDEKGTSWKQVYRHELLHFLRHEPPKQ